MGTHEWAVMFTRKGHDAAIAHPKGLMGGVISTIFWGHILPMIEFDVMWDWDEQINIYDDVVIEDDNPNWMLVYQKMDAYKAAHPEIKLFVWVTEFSDNYTPSAYAFRPYNGNYAGYTVSVNKTFNQMPDALCDGRYNKDGLCICGHELSHCFVDWRHCVSLGHHCILFSQARECSYGNCNLDHVTMMWEAKARWNL